MLAFSSTHLGFAIISEKSGDVSCQSNVCLLASRRPCRSGSLCRAAGSLFVRGLCGSFLLLVEGGAGVGNGVGSLQHVACDKL